MQSGSISENKKMRENNGNGNRGENIVSISSVILAASIIVA